MATVLLFHHLQGLTPGVVAFADALRKAGHTVHTPDLFGGRTFASIEEGAAFTHSDDAPDVDALAYAAAAELPADVVYLGFSSPRPSAGVHSASDAGSTPVRRPQAAASTRLWVPVLRRMLETWTL